MKTPQPFHMSPTGAMPTSPMLQRTHSRQTQYDFSINGLLINPFNGKDADEMEHLIAEFMASTNIEEEWATVVRKGAYLAQDERAFRKPRDDELTLKDEESKALEQERDNKWSQPFILYALVGCCSMGAAVQGW